MMDVLSEFVDGFIQGHPAHYAELVKNDGPNTARIILRNRMKARDKNRDINRNKSD